MEDLRFSVDVCLITGEAALVLLANESSKSVPSSPLFGFIFFFFWNRNTLVAHVAVDSTAFPSTKVRQVYNPPRGIPDYHMTLGAQSTVRGMVVASTAAVDFPSW